MIVRDTELLRANKKATRSFAFLLYLFMYLHRVQHGSVPVLLCLLVICAAATTQEKHLLLLHWIQQRRRVGRTSYKHRHKEIVACTKERYLGIIYFILNMITSLIDEIFQANSMPLFCYFIALATDRQC
jgi:hypothetical protein